MPPSFASRSGFFAVLAALPLAGCHAGAESPPPAPSGPTCASIVAQCVADQQGCVEDAAGARCQDCAEGSYAASSGACEALAGTALPHSFPEQTALAGQEQLGNCRSWTLHNDQDLWVNAVELDQSESSHHSNWVFVPETEYDGTDGLWQCFTRGYDFYTAIGYGGLLFAQSTQAEHEVQRFPPGAAIRVPAHARIISDVHLLNATNKPVTGHATLTLYSLAQEEVKTKLTAFHVEYDALDIPPHATSRFTGNCKVAADVQSTIGSPFAMKVHYLLPHTHKLATRFTASILGGPHDGQSLLDLGTYNGEARGKAFDPPVDLAGSDGVRFACQYDNPRSQSVVWGFGDQEMCELFGFADGPSFFQSRVNTGSAAGVDGEVELFDGPCTNQVYPAPK